MTRRGEQGPLCNMSKIVREREKQEEKEVRTSVCWYGNSCGFKRILSGFIVVVVVVLFCLLNCNLILTLLWSLAKWYFIKVCSLEAQDTLTISSPKPCQSKLEPSKALGTQALRDCSALPQDTVNGSGF